MSTLYTLETILAAVVRHLHPALVSRESVNGIVAIARSLPLWRCTGFECRLGDPEPRADFGVYLSRKDGLPIPSEFAGGGPNTAERAVWQRLQRFAGAWRTKSALSDAIGGISMEYDVHQGPDALAAPSVFFSINPGPYGPGAQATTTTKTVEACNEVVRALLEVLALELPAGARRKLDECFGELLSRVSFLQLGAMLARSVRGVRVCAPGLALTEVRPVVTSLQWQGPGDAYEPQWRDLMRFQERCTLHLDVGDEVSAKLGIEAHFGADTLPGQGDRGGLTRFLDELVERGWCLPEKRDGVLAWVGGFRMQGAGAGAGPGPLLLRTVSHVKLVFQPGRPPEAKVYLAVGPTALDESGA